MIDTDFAPIQNSCENNGKKWRGMTLEQMKTRRIVVQACMEIYKYQLQETKEQLLGNTKSRFGLGKGLFGRIAGAFSFAEYAFLAVKLYKLVSPLFKKSKK